jgi:hypothetical protein
MSRTQETIDVSYVGDDKVVVITRRMKMTKVEKTIHRLERIAQEAEDKVVQLGAAEVIDFIKDYGESREQLVCNQNTGNASDEPDLIVDKLKSYISLLDTLIPLIEKTTDA